MAKPTKKVDAFVKVVIPAKAGIQGTLKLPERLDSRFHGNDGEKLFWNLYRTIMVAVVQKMNSATLGRNHGSFNILCA